MANEWQISFQARLDHDFVHDSVGPGAVIRDDQTGIGRGGSDQDIPTTAGGTVVNFGSVATNGNLFLQNLGATHYILWGPESGGVMVVLGKLQPGKIAWVPMAPGVVVRAQADTATSRLRAALYEL